MKVNFSNIQTGTEKGLGLAIVAGAAAGVIYGTKWCLDKAKKARDKRKAKKAAEKAAEIKAVIASEAKAE